MINLNKTTKYIVEYVTKSGDIEKEWFTADCPSDAERQLRHENWNIAKIKRVYKTQ